MEEDPFVPPDRSTFPLGESPFSPHQQESRRQETRHQGSGGRFVSCMGWSILMHRIFLVLLGKSEAWAEEPFPACRVPVRRIREMAQVSQKSIYEEAAEATTRLTCEPIEFRSRDGEDYDGYSIG